MRIQLTRKQGTELLFLLGLSIVWFLIGWTLRGRFQPTDVALIEQARQGMRDNYKGELPPNREMTYAAIRGMVHSLGDPHAAFLDPAVSRRVVDDFNGRSGIIGLFPEWENGQWVVSVVLPGGAAEQAGLKEGDVILSVDGIPFTGDTTAVEASLLIRGPVGVPAQFVVQRGEEQLTFSPIRQVREVTSAPQMLAGNIGYFAQYTFTGNAPQAVKAVLETLLAQNPSAIIWDLRSNGGGSMDAAQEILSYFLDDGLLFLAELQGGEQRRFMAQGDSLAPSIPLIVLTGERTYSAAETAASSIAERGRGILIGGVTHGKGTIQATLPLMEDTMLQLTIAHWLSPSGEWYEGRGVAPQIAVTDDPNTEVDEVLQAALSYLQEEATP